MVRTLFQQLGLAGVPLGVPDVLPSLQTGLINACYGSPLSTLALQWHSKVRYITSMIISQAIGATVLSKQSWDALAADQQQVLLDESKKLQERLLVAIRNDNSRALTKMKSLGLEVVTTPPELLGEFEAQARVVAQKLETGEQKLFSKEFRARVEKLVADYRAAKK